MSARNVAERARGTLRKANGAAGRAPGDAIRALICSQPTPHERQAGELRTSLMNMLDHNGDCQPQRLHQGRTSRTLYVRRFRQGRDRRSCAASVPGAETRMWKARPVNLRNACSPLLKSSSCPTATPKPRRGQLFKTTLCQEPASPAPNAALETVR